MVCLTPYKTLTAFLASLLLFASPSLRSEVILISPHGKVKTIREGIAQAKAGDTLQINTGVYRESSLLIDKQVTLIGQGHPIIDGGKQNEIIVITGNGVRVRGLTLRNGGYSSYQDIAAIRLLNSSNTELTGNRIENSFFGIYCQHAQYCRIEGNTLSSNAAVELNAANGIHCWKSDHLQIRNNTISGHRDGIYFEFVTESHIEGNICTKNIRYGLHFMFSNNDTYEHNQFINNGAGVAVMYSHQVVMRFNRFRDNWGESAYGLLLKEIADGEITHNQFIGNSAGLYMEGTNRMRINKNRFLSNGWAIKIQANCEGNTITANNFEMNTFDLGTNGSLVLNTFSGNYWDKYNGFDWDRNGVGDLPYRPLSLYSMIIEQNPLALLLFHSFVVNLLERSEKLIPGITPEALKDPVPHMRPLPLTFLE